MALVQYYDLFFKFIDTYAPTGFKGIDPKDTLMAELDDLMENNGQFFCVGDMLKYERLFVSKQCFHLLEIESGDFLPSLFFKLVHSEDAERLSLGKAKLFRMSHEVYTKEAGNLLLSTNFRIKNAEGKYSNILMQNLIYYSTIPQRSAYQLKVHTNIDWCPKLKYGYHYYAGNDLSYFRYPDETLLRVGIPYTKREFEIIKLVATGLDSEEIAEKLFLSPETVFTHRKNILKKSSKSTLSDVIYELIEQGIL